MKLIISEGTKIAKIIGCTPNKLRHNARENIWPFVRVIPPGKGESQHKYEVVTAELARRLEITMEEVERRLEE